eukprot:747364-Hanusia_phi.AAC.4
MHFRADLLPVYSCEKLLLEHQTSCAGPRKWPMKVEPQNRFNTGRFAYEVWLEVKKSPQDVQCAKFAGGSAEPAASTAICGNAQHPARTTPCHIT